MAVRVGRFGLPGRPPRSRAAARERLRRVDLRANRVLLGLSALAALLVVLVIADIAYEVVNGSGIAIDRVGLNFFSGKVWAPNEARFGALPMIAGTLVTSGLALLLAAPIGVAIGLWLSLMAPRRLAAVVGPLVEMVAAVPSVIVGFWGVIVLAPFLQRSVEPFLHDTLGFIPLFGPPETSGISVFTAIVVLTIMITPIVAALSRDLFATVPRELKEGAEALGATRWEMIRGIVLPTTVPGVAAASMLALGRALGEAIAVAEVIGGAGSFSTSLFKPASTMASRLALTFNDSVSALHTGAFFLLAATLLVIGVGTNLLAQQISRRYGAQTIL